MEITFLVGNGFDIGLNMPTQYRDFYKEYCKIKETDDENIKDFKLLLQNWSSDNNKQIIDWSDFEKAFGAHSIDFKIQDKKRYLDRFENFIERFNEYLEKVESCVDISNEDEIARMMNRAISNYKEIRTADRNIINSYYKHFPKDRAYNFVSFNYTNTIDQCVLLLKDYLKKEPHRKVTPVLHIHGYLDDAMVVGVNDPSQILNPDFAADEEVKSELVKSMQNESCRTDHEEEMRRLVDRSDIICIYGMSLGDTDKKWWEYIARWLTKNNDRILVVLKHEHTYKPKYPHSQKNTIEPIRERFLSYSDLKDDVKADIKKRVLVGINNDVFAMDLFLKDQFKKEMMTEQIIEERDDMLTALRTLGYEGV